MNQEIPIFFSTDDNYAPYLDVAIKSLIANASKSYQYRLMILNTGLDRENVRKVMQNERDGFKIDFVDISHEVVLLFGEFKQGVVLLTSEFVGNSVLFNILFHLIAPSFPLVL